MQDVIKFKCVNCGQISQTENSKLVFKCEFCESINQNIRYVNEEEIINWCINTMRCTNNRRVSQGKLYCTELSTMGFRAIYPCMRRAIISGEMHKQTTLLAF